MSKVGERPETKILAHGNFWMLGRFCVHQTFEKPITNSFLQACSFLHACMTFYVVNHSRSRYHWRQQDDRASDGFVYLWTLFRKDNKDVQHESRSFLWERSAWAVWKQQQHVQHESRTFFVGTQRFQSTQIFRKKSERHKENDFVWKQQTSKENDFVWKQCLTKLRRHMRTQIFRQKVSAIKNANIPTEKLAP